MPVRRIAYPHSTHGSTVEYSVQPRRSSVSRCWQAWRMASTSACALGSSVARVRSTPSPTTSLPQTIIAPTAVSPARAAIAASSSHSRRYVVALMPRWLRGGRGRAATSLYTRAPSRQVEMSEQHNLDLVRRIYAAFGQGDLDSIVAALDPQVSWRTPGAPDLPTGGLRHGLQAVREFFPLL